MSADGKNQKQAIVADLLIHDVEIFDGSGDAPWRGSCAIADGRIISLSTAESRADTQPIRAKQEIDGSGFALAPGFIDIHTHDDMAVFDPKRMKAKLSQGVTTVVVGNCGISASPSPLARHSTLIPPLDLLGDNSSFRFTNANDYMEALAAAVPTVNVLPLVGHTVLRARAMDDLQLPASSSQLAAMQKDLSTALAAGMNGFSTGLAYPPAKAASTDEVLALAEVVADVDGLWTTHMRDERSGVVAAVAETIDIARRSGVRTLISHHKCCGEAAFGLSRTTLAMISKARDELRLDLDVYPYTASSTVLLQSFAMDSRKVTVSWSTPHPEMAGRDLDDIATEWGVDNISALEKLQPGGGIYHQMDDADLERIMAYPPALIGSDGLPNDMRPHPRLWGTFPRVLGHYARDRSLFSLQTAIAKMTGQSAETLGLANRGRIATGMAADLVLFDPATIADRADYKSPDMPSAGISLVLVNGKPAWKNEALAGSGHGIVLRRDH